MADTSIPTLLKKPIKNIINLIIANVANASIKIVDIFTTRFLIII